jgi:hypothetical protein
MSTSDPTSDVDSKLLGFVAEALVGSAFERADRWKHACVILRPEEKRVTSRACFSGYLNAHGLHASARECVKRRIPPGSILVWLEADNTEVALASFIVFDLGSSLKKLAADINSTNSLRPSA